jgi:hypothetical protein
MFLLSFLVLEERPPLLRMSEPFVTLFGLAALPTDRPEQIIWMVARPVVIYGLLGASFRCVEIG